MIELGIMAFLLGAKGDFQLCRKHTRGIPDNSGVRRLREGQQCRTCAPSRGERNRCVAAWLLAGEVRRFGMASAVKSNAWRLCGAEANVASRRVGRTQNRGER